MEIKSLYFLARLELISSLSAEFGFAFYCYPVHLVLFMSILASVKHVPLFLIKREPFTICFCYYLYTSCIKFSVLEIAARPAKVIRDCEMSGPQTMVLFPERGGNIHTFRAITPCAVFDVICPPYLAGVGRDCSYFRKSSVNKPAGNLNSIVHACLLLYWHWTVFFPLLQIC